MYSISPTNLFDGFLSIRTPCRSSQKHPYPYDSSTVSVSSRFSKFELEIFTFSFKRVCLMYQKHTRSLFLISPHCKLKCELFITVIIFNFKNYILCNVNLFIRTRLEIFYFSVYLNFTIILIKTIKQFLMCYVSYLNHLLRLVVGDSVIKQKLSG